MSLGNMLRIAHFIPLLLGVLVLSACASAPRRYPAYCPPLSYVFSFAGDEARDCGTDLYAKSDRVRRGTQQCVQRSLANGSPVVYGYTASTPDSSICGFAVHRHDQTQWIVEFARDLSFGYGDDRRRPTLFVGKCDRVDVETRKGEYRIPFREQGCSGNQSAFDEFINASRD